MTSLLALERLFECSSDSVGVYRVSGLELYISDTTRYENARSLISKIKLPFRWRTAKSFQELASLGGTKYNLFVNIKKIEDFFKKSREDESSIKLHDFHAENFINPKRWMYSIIDSYQRNLFRKIGYTFLTALEDREGVNGEVIEKMGNFFVVIHSNKKENLIQKGQEILDMSC